MTKVNEYTELRHVISTKGGKWAVYLRLPSGTMEKVGEWPSREESQRVELAIHAVMIDYRGKRNKEQSEIW